MNASFRGPKVVFLIFALLCIALGGGSPVQALVRQNSMQIGDTLVSLGDIGGDIRSVAVEGGYAYVGEGSALSVIDLSDPEDPTRVADISIPWIARDLSIQSGKIHIAGDGGLLIVDILDPLNPSLLGSFPTSAAATNISVVGNLVFLALGEDGLLIVNASNPGQPVQIATYGGAFFDVWATGGLAYLAGQDLHILDISNPANPSLLGTFTEGWPYQAVHADGSLVYLAAGLNLLIVDASDASSPHLLYNESLPHHIYDVRAAGDVAYFLTLEFDTLDSSNSCHAGALDVSDPNNPFQLGMVSERVSSHESCAGHIQAAGDMLYVADSLFKVIDMSDPASPDWVGAYTTLRPADLAVNGNFVYGADQTLDLAILESGEPFSLSRLGSLELDGWAEGVELADQYALVWSDLPSHPHFPAGRLNVVDVSDPGQPVLTSSSSVTGILDLSVAGDTIYLVDGRAGFSSHLEIIDFSNPSFPALTGEYGTIFEKAESVFGSGNFAYLISSDYPSGENRQLRILDASDPENVLLIGSIPVEFVYELIVTGDLAFLASGEQGLQMIDVSDPAHPEPLFTYPLSGGAWDVHVEGSVAYIAAGSAGVEVVDFSDPSQAILVASGETFEDSRKVAVSRDLVYSLGLEAGMEILRLVSRRTAVIGSQGGSLESFPDQTTYAFPAGAFPQEVTVIHDARAASGLPDIGNKIGIQHAYENAAFSTSGEPVQLLTAYSLIIEYTQAEEGPAIESTLGLYYWDGQGWVLEPSAVLDVAANKITASPDRFGLWAVLGDTNRLFFPLMGGRYPK
jgi:hypothetical protein